MMATCTASLKTSMAMDWRSTLVFHYGSNLDARRLKQRCPDWDGEGLVARLDGWGWAIDKRSDRYGGCAGIRPAANSWTWGVVTHLSDADLAALDTYEGVSGGHYHRTEVAVRSLRGARFAALTYVPGDGFRQEGLRANAEYAAHIRAGLAHWSLPEDWCRSLDRWLLDAPP